MKVFLKFINGLLKKALPLFFLFSLIINLFSFESLHALQGDSRVINYAGIIRGATQKLVNQELNEIENDALIEEIDLIISELQGEQGQNKLKIVRNAEFHEILIQTDMVWRELKEEIYQFRLGQTTQNLYNLSEIHYELSNEMVFIAQEYSEDKMDDLLMLRPWVFGSTFFVLAVYVFQLLSFMILQKKSNKLKKLAFLDPITKLPNRISYNYVIKEYQKLSNLPNITCIYFDLNNLKDTNDTYGHASGDELIRAFGKILKESGEKYGRVFRNGGDEFVAIIENATKNDTDQFMKAVMNKRDRYNLKSDKLKISFAYGIALSRDKYINNIDDLVALADHRMYRNKKMYHQ